jgi:hypothetical protein
VDRLRATTFIRLRKGGETWFDRGHRVCLCALVADRLIEHLLIDLLTLPRFFGRSQ